MSQDKHASKSQNTQDSVRAKSKAAEIRYRQQIVDAYKSLNLSGFEQADVSLEHIPLENIFIRLTLSIEKRVEKAEAQDHHHNGSQKKSATEIKIVQESISFAQALSKNFLLSGEPGAGKSTFLRWLAVTFAQGKQQEVDRIGPSADSDRLPILIELGQLPPQYLHPQAGESIAWLLFLPHYIAGQEAFIGTPPQMLIQALESGQCLLLFGSK